jgi:hypothetical protein
MGLVHISAVPQRQLFVVTHFVGLMGIEVLLLLLLSLPIALMRRMVSLLVSLVKLAIIMKMMMGQNYDECCCCRPKL